MTNIKWSIDEMFKNREAIDKSRDNVNRGIDKIRELKKNKEANIKEILLTFRETYEEIENLYVYAQMKADENTKVVENQKLFMDVKSLYSNYAAEISFIDPLILSLDEEKIEALIEDEDLAEFKNTLIKLRRLKPHTLGDKEEYIISTFEKSLSAPENIYYYLTNADMEFPFLKSLNEKFMIEKFAQVYQQSSDVEVRKESFNAMYDTMNSYKNTISNTLYANMDGKEKLAKLKNFKSLREMELFKDDVDLKVYDALIESIHKYLPYMHKYYQLKKEYLGLEEQHMYDVYLPIVNDLDKKYSFEEAKNMAIESIEPLGEEYGQVYRSAFTEGWIDADLIEGKRGGAYSSGSYRSKPYVLMNFNESLDSVFTLAHEMGHSMHSYYAKKENTFLDYQYTIFVAEVASTFNENLLLDYMKNNTKDEKTQLYLLDFHLNSFKSTVFRQTMFAEFEKIAHDEISKGNSLTAADFDKIYRDLNLKYFGDAMIIDEGIAHEWMRIPHFYSDYYVYKYATGFCAATILSSRLLNGEDGARENYRKFLKDGSKHFPIEQLKIAGIDMSDSKTVDEALEVFKGLVDQLEEIVKKERK